MAYKLVVWKKRSASDGVAVQAPVPKPVDEIPNLADKTEARITMYDLYPFGYDGEIHDSNGTIVDLLKD